MALERVIDRPVVAPGQTALPEATNIIIATIQATDRRGNPRAGTFLVRLWTATTSGGAPGGGGGQTMGVTTGTLIETVTANEQLVARTDATGKLVLSIIIVGAASRWLSAVLMGEASEGSQLTWS